MASLAVASAQQGSEPLKYQTWVLKVPMHCEGCKRKVKKVLQRIDGVYTIAVNSLQSRVTINGNVDVQILIKKLIAKAGKQAEIWPEMLTGKENKSTKSQSDDQNPCEKVGVLKLSSAQNRASTSTTETDPPKVSGETSPDKCPIGVESPAMELQRSESEKRSSVTVINSKKKKGGYLGSTGSGALASRRSRPPDPVDPSRQMAYLYPTDYNSLLVYAASDGAAATMSLAPYYCHVPSSPYTCATTSHQEVDGGVKAATYLDSLLIFSDENANGCFIM